MGYVFSGSGLSHRRSLVEIMHRMRWSEKMPGSFEGLDFNLLIESVNADGDEAYQAEAARRRVEMIAEGRIDGCS